MLQQPHGVADASTGPRLAVSQYQQVARHRRDVSEMRPCGRGLPRETAHRTRVHHATMASLDDLAAFLIGYADTQQDNSAPLTRRAVAMILDSAALPGPAAKHAVLYGFAQEIGALTAGDVKPDWEP